MGSHWDFRDMLCFPGERSIGGFLKSLDLRCVPVDCGGATRTYVGGEVDGAWCPIVTSIDQAAGAAESPQTLDLPLPLPSQQ